MTESIQIERDRIFKKIWHIFLHNKECYDHLIKSIIWQVCGLKLISYFLAMCQNHRPFITRYSWRNNFGNLSTIKKKRNILPGRLRLNGYVIGSRIPLARRAAVVAAGSGQPIRVMQLVKLSWWRRRRVAIGATGARSPRARARSRGPRVSLLPKFSDTTTAGNPGQIWGTG